MDKNQDPPLLPTLPIHLMLSMGTWLASPFALQCVSDALPHWKHKKSPQALQNALNQEAKKRASELLSGISRYMHAPYKREVTEPPVIWSLGAARLLDYGQDVVDAASAENILLFIPSLINRYYILDLEKDRSFLRYLAEQGVYPLVLDWGVPGADEQDFGVGDYVTEILLPAIDYLYKASGQKIALAGYCMGGVLALSATPHASKKISSLSLFATPWDFHCKQFAPFVLEKQWKQFISEQLAGNKPVPADMVQALFYLTDPFVFEHKFRRFFAMEEESRAARDFVALEHWVNDGVAMTAKVARDCLIGWAQENQLRRGQWAVGNKKINLAKIQVPTFIAIPKNDHVVPYECAWPLAERVKAATLLHPSAGHVGMMVGQKAKRECWQPFVEWLRCNAP